MSVANYYLKYDDTFQRPGEFEDLFLNIFCRDYRARCVLQRLEFLRDKLDILSAEKNPSEKKDLRSLIRTVELWPKFHWRISRELYFYEALLPAGPIRRAYHKLRQNPSWYLQPDLIDECARRNGCCGRGGGCCQNRPSTEKGRRGVGHCTPYCACCCKARGSELLKEAEQREAEYNDFEPFRDKASNPYKHRMRQAYFFGI